MKIGDKVVCIDGSPHYAVFGAICPKKGKTYTIREVYKSSNQYSVRLVEIVNRKVDTTVDGYGEPSFGSWRFRKLDENVNRILVKEIMDNPEYQEPQEERIFTTKESF